MVEEVVSVDNISSPGVLVTRWGPPHTAVTVILRRPPVRLGQADTARHILHFHER